MELLFGPNFGPYLIPDEATAKLMHERPDLVPLLRRANALFYDDLEWEKAVQVFDEAQVEPPPEWLREKADDLWASRYMFAGNQKRAIRLLTRAGDVARLNWIGEYLALRGPDEEAFDAFHGAGNFQRIRDVSEQYLRDGFDQGLHGFDILQETPSRELLETFARALVMRAGWPHRMLKVLKAAGIRLPRTLLLEAAKRYRRRIGDCTGALLEIADDELPKNNEGGVADE